MHPFISKLTFAFMILGALNGKQSAPIALIDIGFKKPLAYAEHFEHEQYFEKLFPIVSSDVETVSEGSVQIAKMLNRGTNCNRFDTVQLEHSYFLIHTACGDEKTVSVNLLSSVNGQIYALQLLKREADMRLAQRKLLDFAGYLTR